MANSRRSYRRVRKTDLRIPLLLLFLAALVFFFIVMPKTTVGKQAAARFRLFPHHWAQESLPKAAKKSSSWALGAYTE